METLEHNYQIRLYRLAAEGKLPHGRPGLWHLVIEHDTWCGIHREERCDCNRDFYLYPEGDSAARRKL
jgi:hypothetical protein